LCAPSRGREVVAEWKAKRQMALRAGGSFEVKAKVEAGGGGAFGERQSGDGASGAKGGSGRDGLRRPSMYAGIRNKGP
jgi:hypothetical protein